MRGDPMPFYSQMRKRCINSKEFSDIQFLIGAKREPIYAHRAILSARSEVFRTVLRQQTNAQNVSLHSVKQNPLVLEDEKPEVFLTMLDYMYTNCCTLTFDLAPDLLATSIEYGLDGLRRIASRYMADAMNTDNVCTIFQAAILNQQKELQKRAMTFIEENTEKVFDSEPFIDLSDVAVAAILRSDLLQLDELDLLNSLRRWATTNSITSGIPIERLSAPVIHTIRLALLTQEELTEIENENDSAPFIPVDMLASAWKLHALKSGVVANNNLRLRQGTRERDHHQFIALAANKTANDDSDDDKSDDEEKSDDDDHSKSDHSKDSLSDSHSAAADSHKSSNSKTSSKSKSSKSKSSKSKKSKSKSQNIEKAYLSS